MSEELPRRVGRPSKEEQRQGFREEVHRLYRGGVPIGRNKNDKQRTICSILKCERTTVFRIVRGERRMWYTNLMMNGASDSQMEKELAGETESLRRLIMEDLKSYREFQKEEGS